MHPDVALCQPAIDGVGDRVHANVRVGMAEERMAVRDADPTEPDMVPFGEGMHVKAVAKADVHSISHQMQSAGKIGLARDLEIVLGAFDDGNSHPGPAGDFDIVGGGRRVGAMAFRIASKWKP